MNNDQAKHRFNTSNNTIADIFNDLDNYSVKDGSLLSARCDSALFDICRTKLNDEMHIISKSIYRFDIAFYPIRSMMWIILTKAFIKTLLKIEKIIS